MTRTLYAELFQQSVTSWVFASALAFVAASSAQAATFNVASASDIQNALNSAAPGDTLIMADGVWSDQNIDFAGFGTAANPITLRAQTPGGVVLNGTSSLRISGDYLVVDGLHFKNGTVANSDHVVQFRGPNGNATNSRFTNSVIESYNPADLTDRYHWVSLYGQNNRVDNNRFIDQKNSGVTVVAWLDGNPANHRIDANHFADRPLGFENGFESIRIGTSAQSNTNANVTVENNLFERIDGEIEIISGKSNDNTYRYNTFRESAGTLTLRHGDRATVEGNFFLGENKAASGGVRVVGEDNVVVNNYFADIDDRADGAISIAAGVVNTPANGYQQVRNALIAHNTFVNVGGAAISFDWGLGQRDRTLLAEDVTVAGNLISSTAAPLFEGQEGAGWTWQDNLAFGAALGIAPRPGITVADPLLVLEADGLWRPSANSPAIDASATAFVTEDFDGQARIGLFDIGADERSIAQIVRKPLTSADIGASWFTYTPPNGGGDGGGGDGTPIPVGAYLVIEAEHFTSITDPDNDGNVWTVASASGASNSAVLQSPSGSRTNLPGDPHETLALYDIAFSEAGTYTAYYLARGFNGSSDSFFTPSDFATDPANNEGTSNNGIFRWETGGIFSITTSNVGVPLEFRLGRREGLTELDAIIFHQSSNLTTAQLNAILNGTALLQGDLNLDGLINLSDIHAFALALVDPSSYTSLFGQAPWINGDLNGDGLVSLSDIEPFAALLGADPSVLFSQVPEPSSAALLSLLFLFANRRVL